MTSCSSSTEPRALRARRLDGRDRAEVLARLRVRARDNLLLLELADQLGAPGARVDLWGAFEAGRLRGAASLRPSVLLDGGMDLAVLDALEAPLSRLGAGLVKSPQRLVDRLWGWLAARGRRAQLDRHETACLLEDPRGLPAPPDGAAIRPARPEDLPALVHAARASLREEGRPDPYPGDPEGFRRWVRGRVPRATVVMSGGRIGFVGYADVRRREGWLLQGVYTWPDLRRQGLAAAGVGALCRAAFAAGADHVQLAVVEGNRPAERLYEGLGFRPFDRLRTILFA